jgi:hypothetical protein
VCAAGARALARRGGARIRAAVLGIPREVTPGMSTTLPSTESSIEQDLRPRARTLSWMASLCVAAGELRAAEGYLLELLAWCAFADRSVIDMTGDEEAPS